MQEGWEHARRRELHRVEIDIVQRGMPLGRRNKGKSKTVRRGDGRAQSAQALESVAAEDLERPEVARVCQRT